MSERTNLSGWQWAWVINFLTRKMSHLFPLLFAAYIAMFLWVSNYPQMLGAPDFMVSFSPFKLPLWGIPPCFVHRLTKRKIYPTALSKNPHYLKDHPTDESPIPRFKWWFPKVFPYPEGTLWWTNITMERSTIFNGKIHYKWSFSIAILT
jgi:hypothetical protein